MKKVIYLMFCAITCVLIASSCQNDDEELIDEYNPEVLGDMQDGGTIYSINMMCLGEMTSISESLYDEYAKTHILKNYSDMRLCLNIHSRDIHYHSEIKDPNVCALITKQIWDYDFERTKFLVEDLKDFRKRNPDKPSSWMRPYSAYINGGVKITCDKTLFGLEPGTDLSKYFKIVDSDESIAVGIENPRIAYKYGEERPSNVAEYWTDETWLMYCDYNLYLNQIPSEKYDKLTFSITMPLVLESITEYQIANVLGREFDRRFTEKTLETDCYMFFNWN